MSTRTAEAQGVETRDQGALGGESGMVLVEVMEIGGAGRSMIAGAEQLHFSSSVHLALFACESRKP